MKSGKIALALCTLVFLGLFGALPLTRAQFTPPPGWNSYVEVTLTETAGVDRVDEPVDVLLTPAYGECSSVDEIRVIAPDGVTEIPSQVYDVVTTSGYITSCRVVFLATCPKSSSVTYYIIYNNPGVGAPTYDGLRVYEVDENNTYVNVTRAGVEKKYAHIVWKSNLNLYSDGKLVCWPGGPAGWEFSQIYIASMWADYNDTGWFGANKSLSVVNSGPVFVDFNYTEAGASDFYGLVWDYNVTTTSTVRIYYQPSLNPLVRFRKVFKIKTNLANYTVKEPLYMDFKLANSTSHAIYKSFTWKNTTGGVTTVPTEALPVTQDIWSPTSPVGWWSYNGSRPDSDDKPMANIGFVPINSSGTIAGADYTLRIVQLLQDDDHHCSPWFKGDFNGTYGDTFETSGYIVTYQGERDLNGDWIIDIFDIVKIGIAYGSRPGDPKWNPRADLKPEYGLIDIFDLVFVAIRYGADARANAEPIMEDKALELRNPLIPG